MKNKRILILCPSPYGTAATQRLKYEQYFPKFRENGYELEVSSFQTQRFFDIIYKDGRFLEKAFWTFWGYLKRIIDLFRAPFYDGIYVSLWVTPIGLPLFEFLITLLNSKVVYDLDDMIFLDVSDKAKSGKRLIDRLKGRKKPITLMQKSNYVIVCTPKLEEVARKYNSNVIDISSTFDTNRFVPVGAYTNREITTIGWTGTQSTLQLLDLIEDALLEINKMRKIKFLVISNKEYKLDGLDIEWREWSAETEIKDLHDIEIGLYPIRTDEFSKGKSGLKALTYMSIGIPAVATAWGANFRVIEHGISGFLVRTKKEWVNTIIQLIDDVTLRKTVGLNGRRRVLNQFSLEANAPKYLKAFNETYN